MEPGAARPDRLGRWRHPFGFAWLCAAFGVVAGMMVWRLRGSSAGYEAFPAYACIASFVAGGVAWRILFRGGRPPAAGRGALAGMLAALLGHYLTFVVLIEIANVEYWIRRWKVTSLEEAPIGPLAAFFTSPLYALLSLPALGWLTLPSGAVLGALFGYALGRAAPTPSTGSAGARR